MARYANRQKKEEEEKKKNTVSARAMRNEKARQANTAKTSASSAKQTPVKKSANRSSRTMGNNQGLFKNSKLLNNNKTNDTKKSTTLKRGGAITNKATQTKAAPSAAARRAGLTQNDYKKLEQKTENRKKVVSSSLQQIIGSHAQTVGLLGGYDKKTSGRSMGKYGNPEDNVVNSEKRAKKLSDWGDKQLKKGQKRYEQATRDMSKAGKFGADVANAAIGLASDAAAGPLAPVAMFSRSFGSAANTAKSEGATDEQAAMYGLASGALEAATEKIGSVAKPLQKIYGKGATDEFAERVAKKMASKAKSKTGKDVAYHGGKTAAAFATEALEEMIAEGLDPVIANTIYAEEVGNPHSTTWKEILRAGAVGGVLGGVLGAGGQVVEYNKGDSVREIYGKDGVKALADTAKDSDDDGDALTAEALGNIINEGGGIAAGQALQLKQAVEKQNAKDREKIQVINDSARNVMRGEGLVDIIKKIDENGTLELSDNARTVYEGTKAKAIDVVKNNKQMQLPDETVDEITSEVASIVTGAVTDIDTVNMFTTSNTLARQIYEQTTGETLPATNRETREYLYNKIAENRYVMAKNETSYTMDKIKGVLQQDVAKTYDANGQETFSKVMQEVDVRSGRAVNDSIVTFEDYYEAGRVGITLQEMADLKNPVYNILTDQQKIDAYNAGVEDGVGARNFAAQRAKDIKLTLGQKVELNQSQAKSVAPRGKLIYEFENAENKANFTSSQQTMFQALAREFNINIHITDNPDYNGNYVDGEMWLSTDADRDLSYVFAHEITHHMEKFAPEEYNDFKDLVRTAWGPENLNAAIRAKQKHYADHGVTLSREAAIDEILADSTYEMIQDPAFVTELISEDRGLARQILDALKNLIKKIRTMLAGNDFSPAQNEALLSQLDILKEAERLWEIGLKKAEENRDAVGMVETSGETQYQFAGYAEDGRGIYISDYGMGVPKEKKAEDILTLLQNLWSKKPIELTLKEPGKAERVIQAAFDPYFEEGTNTDAGKIAGGNTGGSTKEKRVNLNIGKDYYKILSEAEYAGTNAEDMQHDVSGTHIEGQVWHYFLNEIYYKENTDGDLEPYTVFVNVRENKDGSFVYGFETYKDENVEKAAKRKRITLTRTLARTDNSANSSNSSTDIISETSENSNKKFSLKDSKGRELSANQAEYFKDSKARDEKGDLLALYHGTAAGEFYVFDKSKGSVEGDFGSGFYFSNNESDMERNYEGGGPDFENKVQREADLMESIEDIDHDEAERIVRERLYVAPNRFEVYLNIKNPAIVGETLLLTPEDFDPGYDIDDFDSEDEYYEQIDQDIQDALEELVLDIERNVDIDLGSEEIGGILYEAFAEGGIGIEALKDKMSEIYLTDSEGDFVSNEVVRQIIESLGYDGIIDPTVSRKWKNMGLTPDTKHFIVFKPEQIKYVSNENPTENPDIRYSLKDSTGRDLSPQQVEFFAKSKARDKNGNLVPVFHTSRGAGFTIFDNEFSDDELSFFFSDSFELSQTYARSANRPAFVDRVENLEGLKKLLAFNEDAPGRGMLEFKAENDDKEILYEDLDEFIEAFNAGDAGDVTYFEIAGVSDDVDGIEADIVEGAESAEAALGHLINQANDNLDQLIYDPGYYEVYLNLKNPLIINGDGRNWNDIQVGISEEYEALSSDINEKIDRYVELVRTYDSNSDRSLVMDSLGDLTAALDVIVEEDEEHDYFTAEELDELTELTTALDDFYYDWQENEHYDNLGEEIWFKDLLEYEGNTYATRDIASMAYDQGYDGVIIRNITDSGQYGSGAESGDVYIAFTSEQIKATTNTTPTMHGDIRYSFKDSENHIDDKNALTYNNINELENDLKERWSAYETDEESRRLAAEAIRDLSETKYSLSDSRRTVGGVREIVADGLSRNLINKGFIDFRGRRVRNAKELAELMQVHRDPRFETFRIVYTKGNKIVGTEAISSQMPGFAPVFTQEEGGLYNRFKYMKKRMARLKADGYYLLHNHPSGVPEPSRPDIRVSEVYATEVPGYKGHVILDHDTYGSVEFNNNDTAGMVHQLGEQMSIDMFKMATVEHPLLNEVVTGSENVAQIYKAVENNDYVASLIFIDSRGKVTGIENVSNAIMNNDAEFAGYLRNACRYYGAGSVAMGTHDPTIAAKSEVHIEKQSLLDCIWFYGSGPHEWESIRGQMPGYVEPNMAFGKSEDDYVGRRVNENDFSDNYDYHDNINVSVDDVNEYVNAHPEEFEEVMQYFYSQQQAHHTRQKTMQELQSQLEKMKVDKKLTHGRVLDPKSIEEDANSLVRMLLSHREDNTKLTDHKLVKMIQENAKSIFTYLKNGNQEDAVLAAYRTAEELVHNLNMVNDEMFATYKKLRDYLRKTRVYVPDEYLGDFPDMAEFRKEQMGRIRLVNEESGGTSVDRMYEQLLEMFPGMFDETLDNPADQMYEIRDVRNQLDPYEIVLDHEETEQLIKEAAHDILELAVNGKPWKSWADRNKEVYDEKIKALKQKHQEAVRDVRLKEKERAEKKIEAVRAKADERLQQTKEKGEQKLQEEKQKNKERQQKQREQRKKRETIAKMEKQISWLSDRLLKPTDDKHLPYGYESTVAQLLYALDTQTERSKKLEEKYGLSKKRLKFLELKAMYDEIGSQPEHDILIDDDISEMMGELAKSLDNKTIADATVEETIEIYKILRNITGGISNINKTIAGKKTVEISERAFDIIDDAKGRRKHHDKTGGIRGYLDSMLKESMISPRDFFEYLGSGMFDGFMEIRRGFDKHVDNISKTREFFDGIFVKYYNRKKPGSKLKDWRNSKTNETFELEQGGEITLNIAQRMSLYCLMKREQAQGHILQDGITATMVDTNSRFKRFLGVKDTTKKSASKVTREDVHKILDTLTEEQKQMADELQSFLSNECAAWGNEASMAMFNYEKFGEPNYFPIHSDETYLKSDPDKHLTVESIRNFGFTKAVKKGAKNPVLIDDIFTVVADHVNKMSMYNAFAAPILDFMRVFNYKAKTEEGETVSVKEALKETFGKRVENYTMRFIADLQNNTGLRTEGFTRAINKLMANYKKSVVAGNLRVALQQPTAIVRAFMLISPKYFTKVNIKKNTERMLKHCQVARWKAWGHNDVDMARDIDDIMMNNEWTIPDLFTMRPYGALDKWTWSIIWGAVEKEVQAKHPNVKVDSDEYFELCNDRASEIFDKTQVVDSPLHKSQVMRGKDTMLKMITSFRSEPTRTYNMIAGQLAIAKDLWYDGEKAKAAKTCVKASYVFLLNAMVCAAFAAVADALRDSLKEDGAGDDDDEEGKLEAIWNDFADILEQLPVIPDGWGENTWDNFVGNANPIGLIPGVSEITSYWQGWGTQNLAFEGVESIISTAKSIKEKSEGNKEDTSWGELLRQVAEGFGFLTGAPVKNVIREMKVFAKLLGWEASAATEMTEEEKPSVFERIDDKDLLSIENGSFMDNVLNRFGWNLTEAEKAERELQQTIKEYEGKLSGLSGKEYQEKAWDIATRGYTTDLKNGDIQAIEERRKILEALGGDMEYFDERVKANAITAYKKTIGTDDAASAVLKDYLKSEYGFTDGKISTEIIAKSDVAKEFQLALCSNDEDAAGEALAVLIDAGITYEDGYVLYQNRYKAVDTKDYVTGEMAAPVSGRVTSNFGYRNAPTAGASTYHQGMDIAAAAGTVVGAADGGKVSSCGYNKAKGYFVKINHGNGRYTEYAHLEGFCVSKGQPVTSGQEIGKVGSTGISTGPHLHFSVIESGTYVDPAPYIK